MAHLEAMRGKGMDVRGIEIQDCVQASAAALRVWEDSNFPYRCHICVDCNTTAAVDDV